MFVPSDTNTTSPCIQQSLAPPSLRKYWRQTSSRLPIKPLYISGAEVGWMLEYMLPTPTVSLSNLVHFYCCSNSLLVSIQAKYMATTYVACVPSCGSAFFAGSNTVGLIGMERDGCSDTIILRCNARSSGVKAFLLLDQCVLRSSQPKHITLILIVSFKASILDDLIFSF